MCHSVLRCVALCCIIIFYIMILRCQVCCSVLHCVAVCCSVLQCVAVCCSVLQCVALSCIIIIYIMILRCQEIYIEICDVNIVIYKNYILLLDCKMAFQDVRI